MFQDECYDIHIFYLIATEEDEKPISLSIGM